MEMQVTVQNNKEDGTRFVINLSMNGSTVELNIELSDQQAKTTSEIPKSRDKCEQAPKHEQINTPSNWERLRLIKLPFDRSRFIVETVDEYNRLRKSNPNKYNLPLKQFINQEFGIKPRKGMMELRIGRGLSGESINLYNKGLITKADAVAIAQQPPALQQKIAEQIKSGDIKKGTVRNILRQQGEA